MRLSRGELWALVALTLVWGFNWPIMKLGVSGTTLQPAPYPPLTFRTLSMAAGLPVLGLAMLWMKVPFRVQRPHWRELAWLALPNMIVWHVIVILAVQLLSSGRSAILGYTMPVFSAIWGLLVFGDRLGLRQALGVAAAALGVALLLAHEFGKLGGAPMAALSLLAAAAVWAYGTHLLRRTTLPVPTLTIAFWMTALTTVVMALLAWTTERGQWAWPGAATSWAIAYNAVGVFGFAHAAWFTLARNLPPVASTISVMMIPVLGVLSGAWMLGEALHWQDFVAMALMVVAIGAVLLRR